MKKTTLCVERPVAPHAGFGEPGQADAQKVARLFRCLQARQRRARRGVHPSSGG
jgi:hypothetical protein